MWGPHWPNDPNALPCTACHACKDPTRPRRTPEARDRLAARSCNTVLSRATLDSLDYILSLVRKAEAAAPPSRAGAAVVGAGLLSVTHVTSRNTLQSYRIPSLLT